MNEKNRKVTLSHLKQLQTWKTFLIMFFFKRYVQFKKCLKTAYKICILYLGLAFDINRRIN